MNVPNTIQLCVSKIVKNERFVKDIFASIFNQGGKVILVGGAVRDLFLDKEIKDLDFEVYGLSLDQLQNTLQQYGMVSLVGKSFGVLRLHGLDVDWSLPRTDSSGRHPTVAYDPNMSFEQAFIRRDLTINAMGIDMQTFQLIDLYGGLQDLQNKILRSPDLNFFAQDPLRLLRVMQFVGRFEMKVDEKLLQLCTTMDMSSVSQERIEQEFSKLFLQSLHPSFGLRWLFSIHKLHEFLPDVHVTDIFFMVIDAAAEQAYKNEQEKLVMVWAVVLFSTQIVVGRKQVVFEQATHQQKKMMIQYMQKVTHNQELIERVVDVVWYSAMIDESLTDVQLKWIAVWVTPKISMRLLLQFIAVTNKNIDTKKLLDRIESLGIIDNPVQPLLTGKDFLDVASGAQLGLLIKKAYQIQIDQGLVDRFVVKNIVLKIMEN